MFIIYNYTCTLHRKDKSRPSFAIGLIRQKNFDISVLSSKAIWLLSDARLIKSIGLSTYTLNAYKCHKGNLKKILEKNSENDFIFVPAFYLIVCLMKASKNFEKIAILKILELVSF